MSDVRATIAGGATWEEVAADRRRHRDATIAQVQPPVPDVLELVGLDPTLANSSPQAPLANGTPRDVSYLPALVLSDEELAITSTDAEQLVSKLASGEWSAVSVVNAFLRRAALAQKLTNCVTELLPASALKRAAELDEYLAVHKKPIGPLHGLPVSVKEHISMKGVSRLWCSLQPLSARDPPVLIPIFFVSVIPARGCSAILHDHLSCIITDSKW